ncbi:transposase [Candidatus Phytoplasma luffae]|uniref:Transposase n=2 Tax=Loofah witches'-broom phytoplasma TaxID=35773 RepID=A0A975FKA3_LOWBP|nr:DDE-type integrase/transposase/recombinase [Candidatus Phytoplasma luffae]QTX02948.1 transposase [Candidatus Phytoplasma luffae]QTX02953.1 transposase [Candidatus Phytoplasma luffae]
MCTDVSYIKYGKKNILYLSAIIDLYNKKIIAYKTSKVQNINLIRNTLKQLPSHLILNSILHADRGSINTSFKYKKTLLKMGLLVSYSKKVLSIAELSYRVFLI